MKKLKYAKPLTIAITCDMYNLIKERSEEVEESMGTIVREILEQSIKQSNSNNTKGE
jgi:hypothetical protein